MATILQQLERRTHIMAEQRKEKSSTVDKLVKTYTYSQLRHCLTRSGLKGLDQKRAVTQATLVTYLKSLEEEDINTLIECLSEEYPMIEMKKAA